MSSLLSCAILLPDGFRPGDILAFHRRDSQEIAERVTGERLQKGMVWAGFPACLSVRFDDGRADVELAVDGVVPDADRAALQTMARRMLGLTQRVEDFERTYRAHPQLGALISRQSGLRVPVTATPFEALTWAITGQQISVGAAVSLRRKLILAAGLRHSGGLCCYPDACRVALMAEDEMRQAGFSASKARTLIAVSQRVVEGHLPLDEWARDLPIDEMRERLLSVRGVGPWTVDYTLLRGFGWLDGSLHGDVAVRRGLQVLLGTPERIGDETAKRWLAAFSPWRALVAAHLWAMRSSAGN